MYARNIATMSDYGMPPDPGAPPALASAAGLGSVSMAGSPSAPEPSAPQTTQYEGGGIFSASTPGPSFDSAMPEHPGAEVPGPQGLDFAPSVAASPHPQGFQQPDLFSPPDHASLVGVGQMGQTNGVRRPNSLGLTVVALAVGAVVGVKYGGAYGGVAGSLFAGSAINALRAFQHLKQGTDDGDKEARVSGTYAVGSSAIAAVIWHQLVDKSSGRMVSNSSSARQYDRLLPSSTANPCAIRAVGP